MKKTLITSYVNPDLDGVAGVFAYSEFLNKTGKEVVAELVGEINFEAKYILDRFGIECPKIIVNSNNFDRIVLIDASDLNALEGKIEAGKVVEIIDHRKINEADKFPNAKIQIELVGAVATLIAEKFIENDIEISKESAILLYSAIISNTTNLKGSVTTHRDIKVSEYLNQVAKLPDNFWKEFFLAKSDLSGDKLTKQIEEDFAWYVMGDKRVGIAQIEIIGVEKLIHEREEEIIITLEKIKKEMNLDFIFQNSIELEGQKNYFITDDEPTKELLKNILGVDFVGNVAKKDGIMMRKQISPLLKAELEG